jgi:hypothetical protein
VHQKVGVIGQAAFGGAHRLDKMPTVELRRQGWPAPRRRNGPTAGKQGGCGLTLPSATQQLSANLRATSRLPLRSRRVARRH